MEDDTDNVEGGGGDGDDQAIQLECGVEEARDESTGTGNFTALAVSTCLLRPVSAPPPPPPTVFRREVFGTTSQVAWLFAIETAYPSRPDLIERSIIPLQLPMHILPGFLHSAQPMDEPSSIIGFPIIPTQSETTICLGQGKALSSYEGWPA